MPTTTPPPSIPSAVGNSTAEATTTTTTTMPPAATSAWNTPFLSGGVTPIIIGIITTGSFVLALVGICAWRKFTGRTVFYPVPRRRGAARRWDRRRRPRMREEELGEEGRGRNGSGGAGGRPVMFEAWTRTALRTTDVLNNWAESPPVAATLFTNAVQTGSSCTAEEVLPKTDGDRGAEDEEKDKSRERQGGGVRQYTSESVQVAVLLQMPSPTRHHEANLNVEPLARPFHGELAIGLIEVPWMREDHGAVRRTTSITS